MDGDDTFRTMFSKPEPAKGMVAIRNVGTPPPKKDNKREVLGKWIFGCFCRVISKFPVQKNLANSWLVNLKTTSRDPGSPAERGIMRPKILCVSEVIGSMIHPFIIL